MTTETKALAKKAPTSPLEKWKDEIFHERTLANLSKALMGTGFAPERFAHTAYMLVARNEKLLVNKPQLWLGVYAAAECGLSLQPHMQQMHLVPFGSEVTPIIGAQGFVYLISKAGGGILSPPVLVFDRDVEEHRFRYRQGTKATCELDPVVKDHKRPRGQLRYAFAVYESATGRRTFKCMDREELLEIRERSKGWQSFKKGKARSSTWDVTHTPDGSEGGDFLPMCAKTVIRHFRKVIPMSTDHWGERAAKADVVEAALDGEGSLREVLDTTVVIDAATTATDRMKQQMGMGVAQAEPSPEEQEYIRQQEEAAAKQ